MDGDALHTFLLDFIPLTEEVHEQNPVFGEMLQRTALELLLCDELPDNESFQRRLAAVDKLLRLACDLGYTDGEVLAYLQRQLRRIT